MSIEKSTMASDLTFEQLQDALGGANQVFVSENPVGEIGVMLSVGSINDEEILSLGNTGVIKFLTRLLSAAHQAQELLNESEEPENQLAAFPPATTNPQLVNGYVTQSATIKSKIAVASASEIIGPTGAGS